MEYYEIIERSLYYIEDRLEEKLNLDGVAEHFHMSRYYFHRLFSAVTGFPLNQHLLSRRLNRSLALMGETDLSLTEIAYRLNFGDQTAFTRAFKREFGISPGKVRKGEVSLDPSPLPAVVERPFKNFRGDLVTDFTLADLGPHTIRGIAFEVDLGQEDYGERIHDMARFKALYGVPGDYESSHPHTFTVELPELFCARFRYRGDLLDIRDIHTSDFSRFLKLSRLDAQENPIELIQIFSPGDRDMTDYEICVPIKKLEGE